MNERINLAVNPSLNKKVQFAQFNSQLLKEKSYSFVLIVQPYRGELNEIINQGLKKIAMNSGNK
jgi:hypothetical protein